MTEQPDPWAPLPIVRAEALEELPDPRQSPAGWVDARAERRARWLAQQRQVGRQAQRSASVWGRR
jgi:hypothetical protein